MSSSTRLRRITRAPERFMDELYESDGIYDRCGGGYVFFAVHKDHKYRQPKRDKTESIQENKLVLSIRNGRKLNSHGYVDDNFIVSDDLIEFEETDEKDWSDEDSSDEETDEEDWSDEDSSDDESDEEDWSDEESDESTDEEYC
jgi:hypothetical protein